MRVVAILGGGDWADASVEHLDVPEELDLEAAKREHEEWLENNIYRRPPKVEYLSFSAWLKQNKGCRDNESVEHFEEF